MRAGMARLMSNKINFKSKLMKRTKKKITRSLHIDKRMNTLRRYNNYKHIYIFVHQQWKFKMVQQMWKTVWLFKKLKKLQKLRNSIAQTKA